MRNKNLKLIITISVILIVFILLMIVLCLRGKLELSNNVLKLNYEKQNEEDVNSELVEDYHISAAIPIFMYHWIKEDTGGYEYPENMVKPSELRKQMEYLKENNYDVIFVSEIDSLQHYSKPVILTFDDGWMDVYNQAFPIAKELNMKICMYVITDLIGTSGYCTIDQLKEMRDSGLVEINSHTITHSYLDTLSEEQITNELVGSKDYIKQNLEIDSEVICYPSGRENDTVLSIAKENYEYGLLMTGGVFNYDSDTSDLYQIPRIYARRSMTLDTFIDYCEQAYVKIN